MIAREVDAAAVMHFRRHVAAAALRAGTIAIFFALLSCERTREEKDDASSTATTADDALLPSAWQPHGSGHSLSAIDASLTRELDLAMQKARETAPEAMARWQAANSLDRPRWLIKWAAPLADDPSGGIEYIWVLPATWSNFRIEGTVVSEPTGDIGHQLGDFVGFPVDELADWVYKVDGSMTGPRQGGFTVEVLEQRFGRPPESPQTPG